MKKALWTLAAMAGMACMGYDVPVMVKEKPKPRNCDQKKCKSCKFYVKAKTKYAITHCEKGTYLRSPMQVACGRYEKRK